MLRTEEYILMVMVILGLSMLDIWKIALGQESSLYRFVLYFIWFVVIKPSHLI